jgi:hypothetical protein
MEQEELDLKKFNVIVENTVASEMGQKISPEEAYKRIKEAYKDLKKSHKRNWGKDDEVPNAH